MRTWAEDGDTTVGQVTLVRPRHRARSAAHTELSSFRERVAAEFIPIVRNTTFCLWVRVGPRDTHQGHSASSGIAKTSNIIKTHNAHNSANDTAKCLPALIRHFHLSTSNLNLRRTQQNTIRVLSRFKVSIRGCTSFPLAGCRLQSVPRPPPLTTAFASTHLTEFVHSPPFSGAPLRLSAITVHPASTSCTKIHAKIVTPRMDSGSKTGTEWQTSQAARACSQCEYLQVASLNRQL